MRPEVGGARLVALWHWFKFPSCIFWGTMDLVFAVQFPASLSREDVVSSFGFLFSRAGSSTILAQGNPETVQLCPALPQ